ncbi:MAG: hypothetical protein F6K65_38540 [Moorea sp. SIO3C2]|nr:hypothetical protein [Moorena sp. SIO3C2]
MNTWLGQAIAELVGWARGNFTNRFIKYPLFPLPTKLLRKTEAESISEEHFIYGRTPL